MFWLGDLNYRIDGISRDEIISKANSKDYKTLLKNDQLLKERVVENCFLEFSEPDITFGPTYRFNRGERTWSEEKMREPAYCDRVLYKTLPAYVVRPLAYQPCHELMTSDHSPIYSTFAVSVTLPAMPHARDPMCKVSFRDVLGHDLRVINGSKGGNYSIVIQAPWITNQVQVNADASASSDGSNQPRWSGDIDLFPISTNRTFLAGRWVRFVVRDGKVDIGVGIVHLEDAVINNQKGIPIRWSSNLADKGRFCGRLSGSLFISFSPSYEDPWSFRPEFGILPSYFDLEPTKRSHAPSRATMSTADFTSQQSEHVIEGGDNDDDSASGGGPSPSSTASGPSGGPTSSSGGGPSSSPSSPQVSQYSNSSMSNPALANGQSTSGNGLFSSNTSSNNPAGSASTGGSSTTSSTGLNSSTSSMGGDAQSEAARLAMSTGLSKPPSSVNSSNYAPAPGSAPVAHVKSGARSWAASRSPRNPPAYNPSNAATATSGANATPSSPQSMHFTKSTPSSTVNSSAAPSSSPASSLPISNFSAAIGTSRPSGDGPTASDAVAIGARNNSGYSSSSLSSTPQSPSSVHLYTSPSPSTGSYMPSGTPTSSSLLQASNPTNSAQTSATSPQISPRAPTSVSAPAPSSSPSTFVPAMNYSGGGIDVRKSSRFSAGLNFGDVNGVQTAIPATNTSSAGNFRNALDTVSESSSRSAGITSSASIDDELAELASIIQKQQGGGTGSASPRSGASSADQAPSPLSSSSSSTNRLSTPSAAAASASDDFAKELAEFELLLNSKK